MTTTKTDTNAFGGTFAFLPTLEPNQKKQNSHQANAQRHTLNDNEQTRQKRRAAGNNQEFMWSVRPF